MAIRITGGIFRGRLLTVPARGVRPTQDRVRAAIFSSLLGLVPGARVLDLFAGTGAFGLEALSRGAALACFVENDRRVAACLQTNIDRLLVARTETAPNVPAVAQGRIINSEVARFLKNYPVEFPFDIIFADPPYDARGEWAKKILFHLSRRFILAKEGLFIIELDARAPPVAAPGWRIGWQRSYGGTGVYVYQQLKDEDGK